MMGGTKDGQFARHHWDCEQQAVEIGLAGDWAPCSCGLDDLKALADIQKQVQEFDRIAIIWDGKAWHARRIVSIEHDTSLDEKIYRCDLPLVNDAETLEAAVVELSHYLPEVE